MIEEKHFNIHSLLRLRIRAVATVMDEVMLHLKAFEVPAFAEEPDITIDRYDQAPDIVKTTVVDDYNYSSGTLQRAASRISLNIKHYPHRYFMDRLLIPINLVVQLGLLGSGYSFFHGAGLKFGEKTLIFPAFPGTGKTTLVTGLVQQGAKLFGDDLCIIGHGRVYSYPQAFSVYPHHLPVMHYRNRDAARLFRRTKYIDRVVAAVAAGESRLAKLARILLSQLRVPCVNVMPEEIFGANAVAVSEPLDAVKILERSADVTELTEESVVASDVANQAAVILWHEWHASFHTLLLYDAVAESGHLFQTLLEKVVEIYQDAFSVAKLSRVRIPASWDNATLIESIPGFLLGVRNIEATQSYDAN